MDIQKQNDMWAASPIRQVEYYYNFPPVIDRSKWFAKKLKQYDFSSIYEPGLFSGRNIKYILDEFPDVITGGLDINKTALEFAKEKLPLTKLESINIYEMPTDDKWDIVFTMGVLIHISPDKIKDVIKRCIKKANKYVIHVESCSDKGKVLSGPESLRPKKVKDKLQWEPNIKKIYEELGYYASVEEVPKELQTTGASHYIAIDLSKTI